jgi:hypothetical protein
VLSHFIEEEGVPTAGISLIRPHTTILKPPRALWVPFELGRPLGPPDNPVFQRQVLTALLNLFIAPSGPVLADYPDDEPKSTSEPVVLSCPVNYSQDADDTLVTDKLEASLRREIAAMRPWYNTSVAKRNRTTVGLCGIPLENLGDFIYALAKGKEPENPRKDLVMAYTVKFAVEDLKSYYIEGITAQPGRENVTGQQLEDWFWYGTKAGEVLLELKRVCEKSPDELLKMIGGHFLVPPKVAKAKK